jgi:type II secretion system protein D
MKPLSLQRGGWIPLLLAVFSWSAVGAALGQDESPASQPANESAAKQADENAQAGAQTSQQPATRPALPLTTYPATQEAQERLARWQEMNHAAAKNGKQAAATPPIPPASQPALEKRVHDKPGMTKEERERQLAEIRVRREEARRKVLEERDRRQAAARQAVKDDRSQAVVEKHQPPPAKKGGPSDTPPPSSPPYGSSPWQPEREAVEVKPPGEAEAEKSPAEQLPAEPAEAPVEPPPSPDDGRNYFISFVNMPWEDVIRHYAKLVGKPLMGETMPFGELTYESPRRFTKEEMLDELNFLLLEQGYFVIEKEDYIYLVPTSELTKELTLDRVFDSVAAFEAAKLRDLEICSVLIQIKDRPAEEVRDMLSPSMPDRALPVVVGETNKIKITGLAQDVRRFLGLMALAATEKFDPRTTKFIKVETNVREIERMVRDYLDIERPTRRYNRETRRFETVGGESDIVIIADERTKNLIVKATPAKLAEIEKFIEDIDQKPDLGEFKTNVIPIKYGSATDIARLLNEILQQEQGQQPRTAYRPPTRTRTTRGGPQAPTRGQQQPTPEDIIVEDIYERAKKTVRIVADERTNNLIVYANEDGLKRVNEILEQIDQPVPSNFQTFKLEFAEPEQIQPTIDQIARSLATSRGGRTGRAPTVIADENLNALHVLAEREDMTRIEEVIKELDVEIPEDEWHFVELKNITASNAARMIAPVLNRDGVSQPRRPAQGRRGPVRMAASSQTIPLDEANTLIVICSDEEWQKAEQILKIADENAVSLKPELKFFEIKNANPDSIANTLSTLYRSYQHPVLGRSQVLVDTVGKQIVVSGVQPALEEIEALLPALDVAPEENPLIILPLENADATQVAQIADGLLPRDARGARYARGGAGPSIQAEPVTNSLIVQADQLTVDRIKAFAVEMDQKVAAQKPERRFYTLKNAPPRDVMSAINSLFGGTGFGRGRFRGGPVGEQVKTVIVGNQVVVDAPASKQAEIANVIEQLDALADQGITTLLVKLPGLDVSSIARKLSSAFVDQVRQQGQVARFEPDPSTETILITVSRDLLDQTNELLESYKAVGQEIVNQTEFYQLKHAEASQVARWLQDQLVTLMNRQLGRNAAQQVSVTPDTRVNRLIISAPQVAVTAAKTLLEQFDVPIPIAEEAPPPPVITNTIKLPALDVANIANQLNQVFRQRPRRPDGLGYSFGYDRLTEMVIYTVPKDSEKEVEELIGKFMAETAGMEPEQKFIDIKETDANYIANQLRSILDVRISARYGRDVANRVTITPDARLNKIFINAPKTAMEMAEALITELDQKPTTESQLQTIALANADANTVNGILRTIFSEKIRARTLSISVEPLTNSLIVGGTKEDFEEIKTWAEDLDAKAIEAVSEPVIIELTNANPWDVYNVLNQTYVQKGYGRGVPPSKQIKISIVAGRSLVVQAPPEKLKEIQELAAKLDEIGQDETVVRKYKLPGLGAELIGLARDVQNAVNAKITGRENRISVTPVPAADTLVVYATERWLPEVEKAMNEFKDLYTPPKIETIPLTNADANMVYQALNRVLQPKIRAGKFQLSVEPITNSLVVAASEEDLAEIREWAVKFDLEAGDTVSEPHIFELTNANPWEVYNVLNQVFMQRRAGARVQPGQEIRVSIMAGRSLIVQAPPDKLQEIGALIAKLDEIGENKLQVRTYELVGMGNRLNELARNLQNAFNQQVSGAREQRITVTAYPPADALIVTAMEKQFADIEQMMDQFKELMSVVKAKTEFFTLQYVDATQIVQTVQNLVQARAIAQGKSSRSTQDFSVLADARTNRLIVFAPESILPDVRAVVTELDVEVEEPEVYTVDLKYADPWETRNMINDIFNRGRRGPQNPAEEVYVTVSNNTLVVKAPPKKLKQVQELLEKVDAENLNQLQIKMYDLKVLNATQVAVQVQMFLRSMQTVTKRGQMQPGAFAEPTTNTLVVIAPGDQVPFIDTLIAQIEAKEPDAAVTQAYVLKNARADEVQRHVDQMLRAKIAEREGDTRGRSMQQRTAVMADPDTNRLFVFAPPDYQQLAHELVKMLDEEVEIGEIVHIIPLENSDATQVAQTVTQTMQGGGVRGRGAAPMKVKVVPDPGSNSIILAGLPKDVAEVESLVKDLEAASDAIPELQYFALEHASSFEVAEALRGIFPTGRSVAETVTVTEDTYYNRLLVTANKRKMRQVEAVVEQLDAEPEGDQGVLGTGKEIYFVEVARGDAFDIAWEVQDLLPPEERGGPAVEADWFGEYIRVICRPSEYPQVERLIRQFDKRAKPEIVIRSIDITGDPERLFQYLKAREYEIDYERPSTGMEEIESLIIDLHPEDEERPQTGKRRAQARPVGGGGLAPQVGGGLVLTALFQVEDTPEQPTADSAPAGQTVEEEERLERLRPTIQVLSNRRILIRGPRDRVDEIQDAIELFEEDLSRGEVIRIFRFRYGDVNAASRILDMMFNERQIRLPQQQRPQQQQQPGQQQRGQRGGREGEGRDQQQQGLMQQIQQMIGGRPEEGGRGATGGQRIRIATDASHNYLIVKCDESLLPDIIQLLRELDIEPAEVDVKVFQLKKLDAAETANNLKEALGISKARSGRPQMPAARGGPQQQLLEILQQQMISIAGAGGVEGSAKIESVEIVPNTVTNSLLVSAPNEVMTIIENIINKMEALEGFDVVVIKHRRLEKAKVDDVLPLLQDIFGAAGGGGGGRRGGGSPADLGPVTVSGDPRTNTLIYVAQAKDVDTVEEQIERLDIEGAIAEVEMYVCEYGDAVGIAEAVSAMFEAGGGGGRAGRRGGAPQPGTLDIRITAEPATNTILVFAPEEKRALILEQIRGLDAKSRFEIREIPVAFARPEVVADKLIQIFGGTGGSAVPGGPSGRGGPRRQAAQTQGRIVVIPDQSGKQLLVRAPNEIFEKMKGIVELLDQPSEQLLIHTFPLKHADAEVVVESVKSALMEFMALQRQLRGEELDIDPFTAVADPRTNSIVVVGSQETFLFVEQILAAVDADTPPDQMKQFRTFVLDRADAQTVADAINAFSGGGAAPGGRGGRRPGGRGAGGVLSTGATIDVQAIADPTTNSVMVYGRPDDIDLIEQTVIEEYEGTLSKRYEFATIEVKEAVPTQLIAYIQPFLDDLSGPSEAGRPGRPGAGGGQMSPRLIGNDNAGTIIVHGSRRQIDEVRTLVTRFDNKDILLQQHEVIPIPWGQDAVALAALVQDLVNGSEQQDAEKTGRRPRLVTVSADEHSNAIIAFGEPSQTALVKTVIQQLSEIRPEKPITRIVELVNLSSAEAEQLINDLQQRRGTTGTRGSSYRRSTPSRQSTPPRSTPSGSGRIRGSRRPSWNWDPAPNGVRYALAPAGFATPFVGTAWVGPSVATVLAGQVAESEPAQAEQPTTEKALTPREQEQQAMLSSISGQLRGEVIATPLDSRRIIVTGDEEDVDFIVQMLALMEKSTPEPVIQVFTLEHTKASAVGPLLEQTMRALIEARGGGDRVDSFSIIAEARSNSLIVSASEPNMEMIAELIEKLDLETLKPTQTKLIPLKHIRAAEAFELLQDAIKRLNDMREVPAASQATIQAVERSNAILVVGTPADITEIERILEGIDVELPPDQDFTVAKILIIDLKNAQAKDLADTLTAIIEMEKAQTGGAGGRSKMPLLRRIIFTTAEGRELPPIDLDKPIVIFAEEGKNSLVILSSDQNNESLLEIVGLFDELPVGEEVEVKSFVLKHANAEQVAELIQQTFEEGKAAIKRPTEGDAKGLEKGKMPPVPPGLAGRGLPYNLVVNHDPRSNTVIVIGRKDAVLLAAGLINELDVPSADLNVRPYVLQLKNIQASTLKEKLDDLLKERLDALGGDKNEARDSAIISADDRSNALVVLATPEIYTMVEDLAIQLDRAAPYSVVDSEFRRLEYADAAKLAGLLQQLFDKKKDADRDVSEGGQKNVLFVFADARSNSLMLTGTRDYLLEANGLVDNLDQAFDPTVQFRLRSVRLNSAANIAALLQDMIEQSRRDQQREMQGTPIHVAADTYSNSLLLAASAEDMLMLERWIDVLDRPAEPGRITRIIPLKRGSAEELARSAQELYRTQAQGAQADVTVTHDATTNSVVAIGPPVVVNDIEDLIKKLNEAEGAGAVVKIFKLEQADAEDAGNLLRSILEGRGGSVGGGTRGGGGGAQEEFKQVMLLFQKEHPDLGIETLKGLRSEVVVIDDLRTNALIVMAPPETMPLMESLVAAIDVPPEAAKIRVFELRNSDAEKMVQMLEELFQTEQAGTRGGTQGEEEMRLTLGELGEGGRQRLAFTVDTRTNSVIAAGTTGYLDLVEELILKLDTRPIQERKTFVFQPANNPAPAIQQAIREYSDAEQTRLNEIGEEISVPEKQRRMITAIASEDVNRIILDYDPRRESDVLELVHDLDQPPPQVMIQVLIVEVTMDNSLELGVEFAFQDLQYTKAGPTDTTTFDFVGGTDIGAAGTGLGGFTFTITGADFNFLIRTLQNEGNLNILSRPQIVAMDNQEARIEISNNVPYVSQSSITAGGVVQTSVSREDIGIILEVTPHINPDGFVRMEIRQEVSDITGSTVDIGQGLTAPVFFKREAETTVTVKDNETVVLGGLITSRDESREQKVPLLGDVPVLGVLFRNQDKETKHTELLVILTPRVVRTVEDYRELSNQERDRTGELPAEVLTSELMNNLRVSPEQLAPAEGEGLIGPFPQAPETIEREEEYDKDVYGPVRSSSSGEDAGQAEGGDPDSYDVPISWAGGGSEWTAGKAKQQK